ncbi:MAG: rhomboid family intramembrane serine protease [Nitrososphaeria archaeon]|nr:rhomboid family intramembrane serine protease [Nitrososphaeria archaeon]
MQSSKNLLKYILLVVGFYLLFCILCIEVEILANQDVKEKLALRRENPFGPITYMIVHASCDHLRDNIFGIIVLAIMFCLILRFNDILEPKHTTIGFLIIPFISPILAAIIRCIILPNMISVGASGVAYAMFGTIFYILLYSSLAYCGEFRKIGYRNSIEKRRRKYVRGHLLINAGVFAFLLALIIVFSYDVFGWGMAYGYIIDSVAHVLSFIISYLITFAYFLCCKNIKRSFFTDVD